MINERELTLIHNDMLGMKHDEIKRVIFKNTEHSSVNGLKLSIENKALNSELSHLDNDNMYELLAAKLVELNSVASEVAYVMSMIALVNEDIDVNSSRFISQCEEIKQFSIDGANSIFNQIGVEIK